MLLAVNATANLRLTRLRTDLPQAVLLSGVRGVGLYTIARDIAGGQLLAEVRPQDTKQNIDNEQGTISVAAIRELYTQTASRQIDRQIVIIDDADRMSHGAQSAFLKLLEEPNNHIHFILTTHASQQLLPTIRSRLQETPIGMIDEEQTQQHLHTLAVTDSAKLAQLRYIAAGLPAELTRLTTDDNYFATRARMISDARTLLQASTYKKLLIAQTYHNKRSEALQLLESTMMVARRSLSDKPQHGLIVQLDKLASAHAAIERNANIRLQMSQIAL